MAKNVFFGKEVRVIENNISKDNRGYFKRIFDTNWDQNIRTNQVQTSISESAEKYTLRGMHYQTGEKAENKFVSCLKGSVFDVVVDVRRESKTFGDWDSIVLDSDSHVSILVPKGFAHGFLTLTTKTILIYQMDTPFDSLSYSGLHWNSRFVGIQWPHEPKIVSQKDSSLKESI